MDNNNKIEVQEPRGQCISCAIIGSCEVVFSIYLKDGVISYYVEGVEVPREAYMDAIHTSERDRYCPNCEMVHGHQDMDEDDEDEPANAAS